jgi:hypothetical protein
MASGTDIFPSRNPEKIGWLKNYRTKLPTYSKTLGFPDARVTASQTLCDELSAALTDTDNKYAAYLAQVAATRDLQKSHLAALRSDARFIKASPAYTDAIGLDLGVARVPAAGAVPSTLKVVATATVRKGLVRIAWKKAGFDSVNVYMRRQGETDWHLLGRNTHSPYDDTTPLAKPGVLEIREYQVTGLRKDQDVGLPSDIISATFAG